MDLPTIFKHIDHTVLGASCAIKDIEQLCKEAIEHNMASVCIPPSFVKQARSIFADKLAICTVIGFPLGYSTTETKLFEAKNALENGADEIDMVINIGNVKAGDFSAITNEIKKMKDVCGKNILKVIVETCYFTTEEKEAVCKCVTEAGADFIKTSTGFGTAGASLADIALFKQHIGVGVKIKASGGIRTREDMETFINAGAERLGTSSAMKLLSEK